jgi:hypothetical protein
MIAFIVLLIATTATATAAKLWPNPGAISYKEFSAAAPTYTIISRITEPIIDVMCEMEKHKINYVHIDRELFTPEEIQTILDYYIPILPKMENIPENIVFLEDKKYIGGIFELYEEIFRCPL